MSRCLVAIPVYNESTTVGGVLDAVAQHGLDILVVDDGSTDATSALLAKRQDVARITHPNNLGYGQSLIDAFRYAQECDYDWVITMDCDEQHEPARIPEFLRVAEAGDLDLISGSRYLEEHDGDDAPPTDRRQINVTINDLLETLLGLQMTDSFCGFKAHRVASLARMELTETGYAFPLQFWVEFAALGLRMRELPVPRIYRDKSRTFGDGLDNAAYRLQHYLTVFARALRAAGGRLEFPQSTPSDLNRTRC